MEITSLDNEKIKSFYKLKQKKYRDQQGKFIVEGEHLIQEAIKANALETLLVVKGKDNPFSLEPIYVTQAIMDKLSENVSSNSLLGICRKPKFTDTKLERAIILENVQDPGNLGTIIRTAYSFGYDVLYLSQDCVDCFNYKVVASCQGALFNQRIEYLNIEEIIARCHKNGLTVYGTSLKESSYLSECEHPEKYALLFGNEGNGVKESTLKLTDHNIKIEMANFESLNVAVACGIASYYFKYGK